GLARRERAVTAAGRHPRGSPGGSSRIRRCRRVCRPRRTSRGPSAPPACRTRGRRRTAPPSVTSDPGAADNTDGGTRTDTSRSSPRRWAPLCSAARRVGYRLRAATPAVVRRVRPAPTSPTPPRTDAFGTSRPPGRRGDRGRRSPRSPRRGEEEFSHPAATDRRRRAEFRGADPWWTATVAGAALGGAPVASGSEGDLVDAVVEHLRRDGFVLAAGLARDAFVVASHRGTPMPHAPELTIPPALFAEYLHGMARGMDDHPDPFTEAL